MNIQDISKDLLSSVTSILEKKNVKEVDEPKAKGEKDFKDLHTKDVKVHTEKKKNVKEVDEPTAKGEKDFKDLHLKDLEVYTEKLDPKADASEWIEDFLKSDAPQFKGKSKEERKKMALAAYYSAREKAGLKEGADKDVKGDKEAYQKFFQGMLKKFGVKSPAELSGDKEKEFYDAIDAGWKADDEKKESIDEVRDMKIKNGKVYISKKDFAKVHKDFKNTEKGNERMSVLDPVTKGTVSMPVVFEDVELDKESIEEEISLDEGMKMVNKKTGKDVTKHVNDFLAGEIDRETFEKRAGLTPKDRQKHWLDTKKESIEEMKEPFIVIDTADKNKVVGTASNEKGAERIIASSERPPISIKDKKTLKVVKSNKKQNVGFPLKEAASNAFYRTTRIHLALRNAGLKPNDAKKVTDALKIIYGGGSEYKGSEVENVVRAVIGDSMGRKLAAKTIEQLHDLSRSVTQKWGFNEAKSATGYEIYHKDFSTAMQHAYDFAKKKLKVEVDPEEIMTNVAMGPKRPSKGKTNSYRLKGKGGAIQVQVYNTGKNYELNMYKESVDEETLEERAKSMDPKKKLKIFNELKKGDKIGIAYDTPMAKADIYKDGKLVYRDFTVTRNKTVVGKARVEKITLAKDNVKSGVKFFLYNRDGKVSMAIGDLAAVIIDMKKM